MADEYELTNADWGRIHGKAWRDPVFRNTLETDPTAAIKQYVADYHKISATVRLKMVKLRDKPDDVPQQFWDDVNPFPPSCC